MGTIEVVFLCMCRGFCFGFPFVRTCTALMFTTTSMLSLLHTALTSCRQKLKDCNTPNHACSAYMVLSIVGIARAHGHVLAEAGERTGTISGSFSKSCAVKRSGERSSSLHEEQSVGEQRGASPQERRIHGSGALDGRIGRKREGG